MFRKSKLRIDPALQSAIVTSDSARKASRQKTSSFAPAKPVLGKKSKIVLAGVAGALLVIIAGLAIGATKDHFVSAADKRARYVDQAAPLLGGDKVVELKPVVDKLAGIPGVQNDPSALYVLTVYSVNSDQPQTAQSRLNQLKQLKPTRGQYRASIQPYVGSHGIDALQTDIDYLNDLAKNSLQNTRRPE